ncbi:unnamed protein product, partial [Closterium sp. NIES-53]
MLLLASRCRATLTESVAHTSPTLFLCVPRLPTDRLSTLIARPRKSPRTYLGCFKKGAVVTDPDTSEFESNARLLGPQYFLHAYSAIYSLSYGVVKILNSIPQG